MDKSFPISDFPFTRSGFLYKIHDARSKFEDAKNKMIDYRQFHYRIDFEAKFYEVQYQFERLNLYFEHASKAVQVQSGLCYYFGFCFLAL